MTRSIQHRQLLSAWLLAIALVPAALALTANEAAAQQQAAERIEVELPKTLREAAPIDLTGWWVAHGSEDWRWRWIVPDKGELSGVPLNQRGREIADDWDPQADQIVGEQCRGYGAAGLMRLPGRLHVTWQDDNSLKIETDSGQQTRLLRYGATPPPSTERSWQGFSSAKWQVSGEVPREPLRSDRERQAGSEISAAPAAPPPRQKTTGQLKVVTNNLRAGYLRKNGVPYSENASMTEYYTLADSPTGDEWLVITTIVEDPALLNEPFITSSNFKRERDGSKWSPTACNTLEPR